MNQKDPLISVVIPAFNVEAYIERCLDSVLAQTLTDLEVIVVNDCTPDRSGVLAEAYAKVDPRVKVINKSCNEGTMMARRTGYERAQGNYLIFCDSDDYLPADSFERLYRTICKEKADIVFAGYTYVYQDGEEDYLPRSRVSVGSVVDAYKAMIENKMTTSLCAAIYNRQLFQKKFQTVLNQSYNEDYMILLQLLQQTDNIHIINESVYYYWFNEYSITRKKPSTVKLKQDLRANQWCYNFLLSNSLFPEIASKHYIRRIVKNLEAGFTRRQIMETGLVDKNVFNTVSIVKYCTLRYLLKYIGLVVIRTLLPSRMA